MCTFFTWIGWFCESLKNDAKAVPNLRLTNWLLFDLRKCSLFRPCHFKYRSTTSTRSKRFCHFIVKAKRKTVRALVNSRQNSRNVFSGEMAQHENYANSAFSFSQFATFLDQFWTAASTWKLLPRNASNNLNNIDCAKLVYGELIDTHASQHWWPNIPLR